MSLFFLFKRAVGILAQPLSLVFAFLLLGLLLFLFTRWRRFAAWCCCLAAFVLCIASFPPLTRWSASWLENQYQPFLADNAPGYTPAAVVVLGNGVAHPGDARMPATSRLNNTALARLVEGVRLAGRYGEAKLIVSGNGLGLENCADAMGEAAIELGIAPDRIIRLPDSMDTEHEATSVRRHMGDAPVLLVTTASHMPRALAYFLDNGVSATPAPCDYIGAVSPDVRRQVNFRYFRPKGINITDSEAIWHEYLGLLYYRWFHRPGNRGEHRE